MDNDHLDIKVGRKCPQSDHLLLTTTRLTIRLFYMPTHTFKPNLSVLRNSAVVVDTDVQWSSRGRTEKKVVRIGSPSRSPQKSPQKHGSPKKQRMDLDDQQPLDGGEGYDITMGPEPLKMHKTKV